eukprot:TRINITY_DN5181_c0_g2_i1.p2 TRINITY_DN5181_c0_g2~~TRINITY_DN5181_c0_g2_i1.p2  ORF type:complete len:126 (-),score=58.08 TRINITY_DN5181_c0_g2_i1:22-348(-)
MAEMTDVDKKATAEHLAFLKKAKRVSFEVKPLDDETDMADLEKQVRAIEMPGLLWGDAQLVPVAFSIKKLQIAAIIDKDLVSTGVLEEAISGLEDVVQSVNVIDLICL